MWRGRLSLIMSFPSNATGEACSQTPDRPRINVQDQWSRCLSRQRKARKYDSCRSKSVCGESRSIIIVSLESWSRTCRGGSRTVRPGRKTQIVEGVSSPMTLLRPLSQLPKFQFHLRKTGVGLREVLRDIKIGEHFLRDRRVDGFLLRRTR